MRMRPSFRIGASRVDTVLVSKTGEPRRGARRRKHDGEDRLVTEPNRAVKPERDPTGKWRREVQKLGRRLGFPEDFLWHWFDQLAMCSEHECKIDRGNSELMGYRLLCGMFDKVNLGMECN